MGKISKQKLNKLLKAVSEINAFTAISTEDDTIFLDDIYKLINDSNDAVTFSLLFYNIGVATTTKAYLEEIEILNPENGSINDFTFGNNNNLNGKTLSIFSSVVVTNLATPNLPYDFKATLVIKGGKSTIKYAVENQIKLEKVGDSILLNTSIFFY